MKKLLSILLVSAMVFSTAFSLGTFSQAVDSNSGLINVERDSGDVYFSENYAEIGKKISICVKGHEGEKFFYKWYLDNKQISNFGDSYVPCDMDLEKIMTVEVYDCNCDLAGKKSMLISELPVVYIEVENRANIVSKTKTLNAYMKIQGNSIFNSADILYEGETEIKGRGNTTWNFSKKPYKLKLSSKANLFGMGKNKHWVLLSNPYDTSNLRNHIAYGFSGNIGLDSQQSVFVDVVLNGTVVGIYQLCEHVRIDSTRVDIHNWDDAAEDAAKAIYNSNKSTMTKDQRDELIEIMTEDLSWTTSDVIEYKGVKYNVSDYYDCPEINGGYLFEIDTGTDAISFKTNHGQIVEIDKPEGISSDMMSYLSDYYNAFENALYSPDYCTVYKGKRMRYTDFIDVESFAKGVLVNEIFENCDFGKRSTWMSMDLDGKIVYGPVWDMDQSLSYTFYKWNASKNAWLKYLISDPVFMNEMRKVYWDYRYTAIADLLREGGDFDTAYDYIYNSAVHNDVIWNCNPKFTDNAADYHWRLQNKIKWLDKQFASLATAVNSVANLTGNSQNINSSDITLSLNGNSLGFNFRNIPDRVSVFSDGKLIIEKSSLKKENNAVVSLESDRSLITVIAYDKNGNAVCGNYIGNEKYVKSLSVSKMPAVDSYAAGDVLNASDFQLIARYSDSDTETVAPQLVYTYSKEAMGVQNFAYGRVSEETGSITAVLMFGSAQVEISLRTKPKENYSDVINMIDNLPDNVTLQTALKPLFETKEAFDALSSEAKARVSNAAKLERAMAKFDSFSESSEYSILGGYIDGVFRTEATSTMVAVAKGKPQKIVFVGEDGATTTHSRTSDGVLSVKTIGNYELWTICKMLKTSSDFDWRCVYPDSKVYGKKIIVKDYENESVPVKNVVYSNSVRINEEFSVTASVSDAVDTLKISENGKLLSACKKGTNGDAVLKTTFGTEGKHFIDISYTVNGVETIYNTVVINVTGYPEKENELMSVKYDSRSYSMLSDIKVATGKDVSEVYLKDDDGKRINLNATEKNGYKIWSADFETGRNYTLFVDGKNTKETIKNIKLGDVNKDGTVNSFDALLVLRFSVKMLTPTEDEKLRADMNGDGIYNSLDALIILQIATGKIQ